MEAVRRKAGALMDSAMCHNRARLSSVCSPPRAPGGTVAARYFMPWNTHPTMAVTGAQCLASCALTPGTIADGMLERPTASPAEVVLEHAAGSIEVLVDFTTGGGFALNAAGLVRTARKLADGHVYIPSRIWAGQEASS